MPRMGSMGDTALIFAAQAGHAPVVSILLGAGAHPDVNNRAGGSPLGAAQHFGHSEVVALLRAL